MSASSPPINLQDQRLLDAPLKNDTQANARFQRLVVNALLNTNITSLEFGDLAAEYGAYFEHIYKDLNNAVRSGNSPLSGFTIAEVLEIVRELRTGSLTRQEIAVQLRTLRPNTTPDEAVRAVNLAAGLLVPLNFVGVGGARVGHSIDWTPTEKLAEAITTKFSSLRDITTAALQQSHNNCQSCSSSQSFSKKFNARQIEYIAGFEIVWTSNLLNHLLLLDGEKKVKVYVFHQVKLLRLHQDLQINLLPADLITETFSTLSLLLPRTDRRVRHWYQNKQKKHQLDPSALYCSYLKLEDREVAHFKYWGDRLMRLKRAYDNHEPTGPLQWWRDDRKPVQWWTFWIAALVLTLTIIFGGIQSVTSILQVTRASPAR